MSLCKLQFELCVFQKDSKVEFQWNKGWQDRIAQSIRIDVYFTYTDHVHSTLFHFSRGRVKCPPGSVSVPPQVPSLGTTGFGKHHIFSPPHWLSAGVFTPQVENSIVGYRQLVSTIQGYINPDANGICQNQEIRIKKVLLCYS